MKVSLNYLLVWALAGLAALPIAGVSSAAPVEPGAQPDAAVEPIATDEPPKAETPKGRRTRLQGTAMIDRRRRVTGAVVQVRSDDDPSKIYLTSTDDDGDFLVDSLLEGSYSLTLARTGYVTVIKKRVILKFPFRSVVEVTMTPTGDALPATRHVTSLPGVTVRARGVVADRDGGALSEVRVRFVHPDGMLDPRAAKTDAAGRFEIPDLAAGSWELEFDGVGYLPLDVALDLTEDTELRLRLIRQPADYEPSPLELMPPEKPTPPPGFEPRVYKED